jgi:hypothetical protein
MAKSSINFAKATSHSEDHNLRKDEPSYLLPKEHRLENEFWKHEKKESELFSKSAAKQKTGKKPKLENSRWEAIINFNKNHSLGDLKKVAEHIEKKFNITCTSIAMHKDEGHINERGIVQYNLHAHVNFMTHKDGKQNWRKEFIKPKDLRELQTEVAELLDMERGMDKRLSKTERLEHTQFKAQAKGLAKQKDLKAEIAELRAELQANKASRADYAELEALNQDLKKRIKSKDLTISDLKSELEAKISPKNDLDVQTDAKTDKTDLKAIYELLNATNLVGQYDKIMMFDTLDGFEKQETAGKFTKLVREKGEHKKPSLMNKRHTVTFDMHDLESFRDDLSDADKSKARLLESIKSLFNKFEKPLNAVKSFVHEHFTTPKAKERMKERQKEKAQTKDRGLSR